MSRLCHDRPVNATAPARSRATGTRTTRIRLDQLLVERGLAPSRARAQALLLGGRVRVGIGDAARSDRKAGDLVDPAVLVDVVLPDPYVSRGGHKLAAALDAFGLEPEGLTCLDVGASTGGFTDVLLQRGAHRVYALDVGRGQLAELLRADARVVSMERTNARTLTAAALPEPVSLATIDVSFISLRLLFGPVATTFGLGGGTIVALVKPQFEAGRGQVPGGVVRDPAIHRATVERVVAAAEDVGLMPLDIIASPILGPEGKREFLLHLSVPAASAVRAGAADAGGAAATAERLADRIADVTLGDVR